MTAVETLLQGTPYQGYAYAYPHKTAYRPLPAPIPLDALWANEPRDALFLYLHVPFCEMRCGFCNLFTTANPNNDFAATYLRTLQRQAERVRDVVGEAQFARFAIGGGTPTFLGVEQLEMLLNMVTRLFGIDGQRIPVSVETSPRTAEIEKLRQLRDWGVDRISIGVQSFVEAEVAAVGRAQKTAWVEDALTRIRETGFPTLNVDLIYGLPGQSIATWLASLRAALRYAPEEIYLYPLYVRPLTGLGRKDREWDDIRLACYRAGRDLLRAAGYTQISMRMFARRRTETKSVVAYCCQNDGMVGIGCGARSYTRGLHYSGEYAVGASGVRAILADYMSRPDEAFTVARYGFALNAEEQRRRFVIQSLLQAEGVDFAAYRARFGTEILEDFPEELCLLECQGLATRNEHTLTLTEAGLERADSIGPALYSQAVRERMARYELH
jgi:oxygen-independent coproporphyrinogen III oxidase